MSTLPKMIGILGFVVVLGTGIENAWAACPTAPPDYDCKCNAAETRWVCATWDDTGPPNENVHFFVTYTGDIPEVKFKTANDGWVIYSEVLLDGVPTGPADLGDVLLRDNVVPNNGNFTVSIKNGADAGAVNVSSIVLNSSDMNWTGYSSMGGVVSLITGNLGGLTLVKDSAGNGGVLAGLLVQGNLTGPLSVTKVTSIFNIIAGDATENADIVIGEIDAGEFHILGSLLCNVGETVCADITVTGRIHDGLLHVDECVEAGSTVTIQELVEPDPATGITEARFYDFAGTLFLPNGLENPDTKANLGHILSGVVDLNYRDVVGELDVYVGTSTAVIKNGGAVSGDVYLSQGSAIPADYAGTATFASVSATGEIGTEAEVVKNAQLSGTITVTGNMLGLIEIAGSVLPGGVIDIGGSMTGDIDIEVIMSGTITVTDDVSGDIHLKSHLSSFVSSISVGGSLSGRGRILVDDSCGGSIAIGKDAGSLSLIHCKGGLAANAKIKINTTKGDFNAEGDIHVGPITFITPPPPALPPAITFDGCIRIFKQAGGNGGDLTGTIKVVGCHADNTDLNICVDGGDGEENITIHDAGCPNQPEHSCGTCT